MSALKTNLVAGFVAVAVMVLAVLALAGGEDTTSPDVALDVTTSTAEPPGTTIGATDSTVADRQLTRYSDLDIVFVEDLPAEARITLTLIDQGGPYPYRQDDGTFQNREGILPDRDQGHYREYTVDTPGSPDRGARRIVAGADGERYYTDDHYESFREVVE